MNVSVDISPIPVVFGNVRELTNSTHCSWRVGANQQQQQRFWFLAAASVQAQDLGAQFPSTLRHFSGPRDLPLQPGHQLRKAQRRGPPERKGQCVSLVTRPFVPLRTSPSFEHVPEKTLAELQGANKSGDSCSRDSRFNSFHSELIGPEFSPL